MQAQAASGGGKLADAVTYYNLKHKVDPSTIDADAYVLGTIYQRLGQKDQAITQYKLAITYANSHHNQYGSDAPAIQAAIDELEGKTE
jgi:tetratricopeptide (TPR) repeat protein